MQAHQILWPVLIVLAIPLFILLLNAKRKVTVHKTGEIDPNAAIDNKAWPLPVLLTSNALSNQFQLPVVFYVLCLVLYSIDAVSSLAVYLAWAFAVLRWVHAIVHVTSNAIPLRIGFFLLSSLTLLSLFIYTVFVMAKV